MSSQGFTLFRDSFGCTDAKLFIISPRCVMHARSKREKKKSEEKC